jgi:hypothetical protein
MGSWSGPFLIAAVLLAAAGLAKAFDPIKTVGALRGLGLPVPAAAVRTLGVAEAGLAVTAAITGLPALAVAVGLSYVAFTGFVVLALVRHAPIGTCGCFGKIDTPPSWIHVVVDSGAALSAFAVAAHGGGTLVDTLRAQPLAGVPLLGLVVVGAYAAFTGLTVVPQITRGAFAPARAAGR